MVLMKSVCRAGRDADGEDSCGDIVDRGKWGWDELGDWG